MYTGWIPSASGTLSFSHIGGIPVRNRTFSEDVYPPIKFLEDARCVSLLQERNLSDRPNIGHLHSNPTPGRLVFLLQGKLEFQGGKRFLIGYIFCAPYSQREHLHLIHDSLRSNQNSSLDDPQTPHRLQTQLHGALISVSFQLCDDGVVEIIPIFKADPATYLGRLQAFECYSFLKDVLHRHRFHSPNDDALLELTPIDSTNPDLWASRVARNLHRSVISSFRSTLASAQIDGLGKLSYLTAFLEISANRGLNTGIKVDIPSLRSALEANQSRAANEKEQNNVFITFMLTMFAIVLPILFVGLQLLQIPCIDGLTASDSCTVQFRAHSAVLKATGFILIHLPWVLLAACIIPAAVILITNRKRFHSYSWNKLPPISWTADLKDLILRLAVSSRPIAIAITSTIGIGIIILSLWAIKALIHRY